MKEFFISQLENEKVGSLPVKRKNQINRMFKNLIEQFQKQFSIDGIENNSEIETYITHLKKETIKQNKQITAQFLTEYFQKELLPIISKIQLNSQQQIENYVQICQQFRDYFKVQGSQLYQGKFLLENLLFCKTIDLIKEQQIKQGSVTEIEKYQNQIKQMEKEKRNNESLTAQKLELLNLQLEEAKTQAEQAKKDYQKLLCSFESYFPKQDYLITSNQKNQKPQQNDQQISLYQQSIEQMQTKVKDQENVIIELENQIRQEKFNNERKNKEIRELQNHLTQIEYQHQNLIETNKNLLIQKNELFKEIEENYSAKIQKLEDQLELQKNDHKQELEKLQQLNESALSELKAHYEQNYDQIQSLVMKKDLEKENEQCEQIHALQSKIDQQQQDTSKRDQIISSLDEQLRLNELKMIEMKKFHDQQHMKVIEEKQSLEKKFNDIYLIELVPRDKQILVLEQRLEQATSQLKNLQEQTEQLEQQKTQLIQQRKQHEEKLVKNIEELNQKLAKQEEINGYLTEKIQQCNANQICFDDYEKKIQKEQQKYKLLQERYNVDIGSLTMEIQKEKEEQTQTQDRIAELEHNYQKECLLWEGRLQFAEEQKEKTKQDYDHVCAMFESTVRVLKKSREQDKQQNDQNFNELVATIDRKAKEQLNELAEGYAQKLRQESDKVHGLNKQIEVYQQQIKSLQQHKVQGDGTDQIKHLEEIIQEKDEKLLEYQKYMQQESDNFKKQLQTLCEKIRKDEEKQIKNQKGSNSSSQVNLILNKLQMKQQKLSKNDSSRSNQILGDHSSNNENEVAKSLSLLKKQKAISKRYQQQINNKQ